MLGSLGQRRNLSAPATQGCKSPESWSQDAHNRDGINSRSYYSHSEYSHYDTRHSHNARAHTRGVFKVLNIVLRPDKPRNLVTIAICCAGRALTKPRIGVTETTFRLSPMSPKTPLGKERKSPPRASRREPPSKGTRLERASSRPPRQVAGTLARTDVTQSHPHPFPAPFKGAGTCPIGLREHASAARGAPHCRLQPKRN